MAEIEYFYSAYSAFAYLGSARFMAIAGAAGQHIRHRPVDLPKVIAEAGVTSFQDRTQTHRAYYFGREIERWAEYRGAPVIGRMPTHHRKDMALPNGMVIAGELEQLNVDRLAHRMLESHWREDTDLTDRETLARLGTEVGLDPTPLLDQALTERVQGIYRANTEEAIRRSVFGSPTYFVDGDMFYGQDRLELVERALQQPFAGDWPRVPPP